MAINLPDKRQKSIVGVNDDMFPSLAVWRDGKLRDLTYALSSFFNCISEPRDGFSLVENNPTDPMSIPPTITGDMINYVIGEIFPCSTMIKEGPFTIFKVPTLIREEIENQIKRNISNRSFLSAPIAKKPRKKNIQTIKDSGDQTYNWNASQFYDAGFTINPEVAQIIWTYLSNGMDSLAYGSTTDQEVVDKIVAAEATVLSRRNCSMNYGFNDDLENCSLQAILYVLVTILDWLEDDNVTETEVTTVYKILYPRDMQSGLSSTTNKRYADIISMSLASKNLIPTDQAIRLITTMMLDIGKHMNSLNDKNSKRILNRFMGFCQPV